MLVMLVSLLPTSALADGYSVTYTNGDNFTHIASVTLWKHSEQDDDYIPSEELTGSSGIFQNLSGSAELDYTLTVKAKEGYSFYPASMGEGWGYHDAETIVYYIYDVTESPTVVVPSPVADTAGYFDPCNGSAPLAGATATTAPETDPTWGDYVFLGWYTARTGGEKVTEIFTAGTTYYAHWQVSGTNTNLVLTEGLVVKEDGELYVGRSLTPATKELLAPYGIEFDETTAELSVNNAVIDTWDGAVTNNSYRIVAAIYSYNDLSVNLTGENTVCLKGGTQHIYGIRSDEKLSLTGSGSLNVALGKVVGYESQSSGICSDKLLNVEKDVSLTVNAESSNHTGGQSAAVCTYENLINNGVMNVTGYEGVTTFGSLENNGTIEAVGVIPITSEGEIRNSGTLEATSNAPDGAWMGVIHTQDSVENSGTMIITSGDSLLEEIGSNVGLFVEDEGKVKNSGTITITLGNSKSGNMGALIIGDLENTGILTVTLGEVDEDSTNIGLQVYGNLNITGGRVSANDKIMAGIGGSGTITAPNATVTGANETFTSGTTTTLTQSGADPIVIQCSTTFDPCNGDAPMAGADEASAPAVDPAWGDYVFDGWYTARTGGTKATSFDAGSIYYAHWKVSGDEDANFVLTEPLTVGEGGLYVGDSATAVTSLAGYGISFTAAAGDVPAKLALNNAALDTYDGHLGNYLIIASGVDRGNWKTAIYSEKAFSFELTGENIVRLGSMTGKSIDDAINVAAILVNNEAAQSGAVTFGGTGKLTAETGKTNTYCAVFGLYVASADIVNEEEATLNITSGDGLKSVSVFTDKDLQNKGTMTAVSGTASMDYCHSAAIGCLNLDNSGTMTAVSDASTGEIGFSFDVNCGNDLTNSGTLTATAGDAYASIALYMASLSNSGSITATAGDGTSSVGVMCGALTNRDTLTATAGDATGLTTGIYATAVDNSGTLTATAGGGVGTSASVMCEGALTNTGVLTAKMGSEDGNGGIAAVNLTITDGMVISYDRIAADEGIIADGAAVTGANEVFTSGETEVLTRSGKAPIVIVFGAIFDPCNGKMPVVSADAPETDPERVGYTFAGWYTATTGGSKVESGFAKGTTYYAQWTEKTATLTYDANGHGKAPDSVTMRYSEAVNAADALTAGGYTFTGWNTEKNGSGTAYAAGEQVKAANVEPKAITLYAQWTADGTPSYTAEEDSYPITKAAAKNGSFSVSSGSAEAGKTVTITVKPDEGFAVDAVTVTDKTGKSISVTDAGGSKYTFTMPASAVTVSVTFRQSKAAEEETQMFFVDVKADDYFCDAVRWAAEKGITKGIDETHFGPYVGTTRAQVVTFLWRAAGSPEPTGTAAKFTDVLSGSYYEKAVAWAIEQGITKGTSPSTFSPYAVCTRAQITTFLARYAGVEDTDTESVFSDVNATDYFAAAVKWAKDNGVTDGVSKDAFGPSQSCTRAQTVTLLFRWAVR